MIIKDSLLRKSLGIHHSCLIFVLGIYMMGVAYNRLIALNMGLLSLFVILPIKIYLFSGIYGVLTELVSKEEITSSVRVFKANANRYWKIVLLLTGIPACIYFPVVVHFFKLENISIYAFYMHLHFFISFFLALLIINNKYIYLFKLKKRKINLTGNDIKSIFGLIFLQATSFYCSYYFEIISVDLSRITLFLLIYINQLIFIYITALIQNAYPEIAKNFDYEKEIYLINPPCGGIAPYFSMMIFRMYPPFFLIIKALTPKTYRFREFNRIPWHSRYCASNKLVAISCFTSNCDDAYRIALEFKKRGSKVVMGGPHVTYLSDEALQYCDSVVLGEMESVWQNVIEDYENNSLKKIYRGYPLEECHDLVQ